MALDVSNTRQLLQSFNFQELFREELGWESPSNKKAFPFQTKQGIFYRKAIAELSGASVFEITNDEGTIPDNRTRDLISKEIQRLNYEHILIFVDKARIQSIWRWLKKQDKKSLAREHYFSVGQPGDLFISKLSGLLVDISEIENDITITDVAKKIQNALDIERVTKRFFKDYQQQFIEFLPLIEGIDNEADKRWYASVILNRLMFIYFLQEKGFINNGDRDYLYSKLKETKKDIGKNKYYSEFLKRLFFEGFAKPEAQRSADTNKMLGKIKYLNGGLFLKHKIEEKYPKIAIPDVAFENLLKSDEPKGLFEKFSWSLDDTPGGKDDEINPDVLGYIFEKYINQKAFGAYYTRTEITEYLCEQTVYKLILDAVNEPEIDPELLKKAGLDTGAKPKHYDTVAELLLNLDAATCKKLIYGDNAVLPNLSLLDPACGSGAFLVAAMKTLINVYSSIVGKIDFLGDNKLVKWKKDIERDHPSINYYIKKKIITNNLYGVDIMEEATEIAKLRLFLALVSSAQSVDQLEPLPNIDFNIMSGNSLIGMMRVDPSQFNKLMPKTAKNAAGKTIKSATLFSPGVSQTNMFGEEHAKGYQQLINEKEAAISAYKNAQNLGLDELQALRNEIQQQEQEANKILNQLLVEEFYNLDIRYESITWDEENNKEGRSIKRPLEINDIKALEPFHWGYEFSEIFRKKNGFDAIITNPPWEVFQTNEKEFFQQFDGTIQKKKLRIEDWERNKEELMQDKEIRNAWLTYASQYPHQWGYFKRAAQYINQTATINGKAVGNKPNLYCLFLEQSKNLLKDKGYCGIVIPSGIYTDLGTKQLREMLFEETKITGLFGFENRKIIFENVDSRFKFVVLSFEKDDETVTFPAAFMRLDVEELASFPEYASIHLSVDTIKKISPDSFSIIEVKNDREATIIEKAAKYPLLADSTGWGLALYGEELNMTRSREYFVTKPTNYPLFEGGMIHQFNAAFDEPRYWIKEKEIRDDFLTKKVKRIAGLNRRPKSLVNDYETYRLAIRKIARNTDARTLISTILPKYSFTGNSLSVNFPYYHTLERYQELKYNYSELVCLVSILNSFVVDFILRLRVNTNLNLFYLDQIPVPRLSSKDKWFKPVITRACKLICTSEDFSELWEEVMKTKWSEKVAATTEFDRNQLRAELDGIVAHLYDLTEDEFTYILNTFPIVAQSQKVATQNAYRDIVNGMLK